MKSNSCTKPFAEFIRKNSHIELGNERINDTLHSFIKLHHPENSNEKSRNSSYVNESEEMGREGKGYSLSTTANDDTCGELYFPKLIPKYCIPVFLRTLTLLFAPSEPKSFK